MTKEIIRCSEEELKRLSDQELLDGIKALGFLPQKHKTTCATIIEEIRQRTDFLETDIRFAARIYCLEHGIKTRPICIGCGKNPTGWNTRTKTFGKHCCTSCAANDPDIIKQREETCLKRHGVRHPLQSNVFLEKAKHTTMKHHGVEHPLQSKQIFDKAKQTCKKHNGVEYPLQSKQIFEQMKQDNFKKHGVEYVGQMESAQRKSKETCNDRYGVDYSFQAEEVKAKIRASFERTYGVSHYAKSVEFGKKCHKRYTNPKYPDMEFATSWEFKVYDFLTENHIPFEYQPSIAIPFYCEGTHHTYHPDFKVGDRIVEVKGDNFFRINPETGKEEMYLTWQGDLSDEEYEWRCKVMEAKHQCMLANNVIILRERDIKNLTLQTFGVGV